MLFLQVTNCIIEFSNLCVVIRMQTWSCKWLQENFCKNLMMYQWKQSFNFLHHTIIVNHYILMILFLWSLFFKKKKIFFFNFCLLLMKFQLLKVLQKYSEELHGGFFTYMDLKFFKCATNNRNFLYQGSVTSIYPSVYPGTLNLSFAYIGFLINSNEVAIFYVFTSENFNILLGFME